MFVIVPRGVRASVIFIAAMVLQIASDRAYDLSIRLDRLKDLE